jgi:hypothetical protein
MPGAIHMGCRASVQDDAVKVAGSEQRSPANESLALAGPSRYIPVLFCNDIKS